MTFFFTSTSFLFFFLIFPLFSLLIVCYLSWKWAAQPPPFEASLSSFLQIIFPFHPIFFLPAFLLKKSRFSPLCPCPEALSVLPPPFPNLTHLYHPSSFSPSILQGQLPISIAYITNPFTVFSDHSPTSNPNNSPLSFCYFPTILPPHSQRYFETFASPPQVCRLFFFLRFPHNYHFVPSQRLPLVFFTQPSLGRLWISCPASVTRLISNKRSCDPFSV